MKKPLTKEQNFALEKILDSTHLASILESLSKICYAKAEHITCTWQDQELARLWERAGNKLAADAVKYVITQLP